MWTDEANKRSDPPVVDVACQLIRCHSVVVSARRLSDAASTIRTEHRLKHTGCAINRVDDHKKTSQETQGQSTQSYKN